MLGMRAAVERLERAIAQREPMLIYGDYDVDGTMANGDSEDGGGAARRNLRLPRAAIACWKDMGCATR